MARKLIEVAIPLDAINRASKREKSIRHGHPSTLHLYWARRPLAAARAVIFAQMVDDPSEYVDVLLSDARRRRAAETELRKSAEKGGNDDLTIEEVAIELERKRLFRIIEELVVWENSTREDVLDRARDEIWQSWRRACVRNAGEPDAEVLYDRHKLPPFHDPFCGGGAIPLEAQRLGLEAHATDLNPVAVLINKAMLEIPPRFAGRPAVNLEAQRVGGGWNGAEGLAADVAYYSEWMRARAKERIGHLYPKIHVTVSMARDRDDLKNYVGRDLTVIAWLHARTVRSPNPAFSDVEVPLVSSYLLSSRKGKEVYLHPVVEKTRYRFEVRKDTPPDYSATRAGTKQGRASFRCIVSGTTITAGYIRKEGQAGRLGSGLIAIVADGAPGRIYLPATPEHEEAARAAHAEWRPDLPLPKKALSFSAQLYGFKTYGDLYTERQVVALTAMSDLVEDVKQEVEKDAIRSYTIYTHVRGGDVLQTAVPEHALTEKPSASTWRFASTRPPIIGPTFARGMRHGIILETPLLAKPFP